MRGERVLLDQRIMCPKWCAKDGDFGEYTKVEISHIFVVAFAMKAIERDDRDRSRYTG